MGFKKPKSIALPQSILGQLESQEDDGHIKSNFKKRKVGGSRKEVRKKERTQQKQKKAQFYAAGKKRNVDDRDEGEGEGEGGDAPNRKRFKLDNGAGGSMKTVNEKGKETEKEKEKKKRVAMVEVKVKKSKTTTTKEKVKGKEKVNTSGKTTRIPPPSKSQIEEHEDRYIAILEKKLGYKGVKTKKKSVEEEDGLEDLLDFADSLSFPRANYGDESDEDMEDEEGGMDMDSESDEEGEDEEDEEWGGITLNEEGSEEEESAEENKQKGMATREKEKEDSKTDETSATPATRYIPPHLRKKDDKESEEMVKLKKQLKGLLNRMSEQNLASIIDSIEELYRSNRRHDVTSCITNLVVEGTSSHSMLLDSYVVLHAALISSLHKLVGIEFAAYFVQNVVATYERHFKTLQTSEPQADEESQQKEQNDSRGKECSNLMVLLSELYNFQVISSVLVFDLIRQLLKDELTEFNVDLLLKLMRNSGQQLRQDDPSALKDIIGIVQQKVTGKDEELSSRTKFMIETLINLKNNKLKRNVTQNQGGEAVERMKKFLSNLTKKKHVLAHDALRVSLEDLHSAESKGKWWLVGAAWGGNPLVDAQDSIAKTQVNGQVTVTTASEPANDLLKLARKQGMNTDIRRSIFVVLMSSDDYVDACERLSQLNLTEFQQREIVRVLLHCCGNEKMFNPYYILVCQQLCSQSHSYKITLQFCLWDFLRDLGETTVGGAEIVKNAREDDGFDLKKISNSRIRNVAKAYAWWISKDVVSLSILKAVDFTILKEQSEVFLRELFTQLFISSQTATPLVDVSQLPTTRNRAAIEEIFVKATRIENLAMGLVYFLSNAFKKYTYEDENLVKLVKWANALALDTLRTGVDIIPTL